MSTPNGASANPGDAALSEARAAVVAAGRALADAGLVSGTSGNLSARVGDLVVISPTGSELARLDSDELTVVDLDGGIVAGTLAPASELALHLSVYRNGDAGAIAHTHPPVATALACVIDELPCIHPDLLVLGGAIRVAPYRVFGTPELAADTLAALGDRRAVLMSNHGALVTGQDPADAVRGSLLLEWASEVYWRAAQLGTPRSLEPDAQAAVSDAIREGYGHTRPLGDRTRSR